MLVSACMLGRACRYDGRHSQDPDLLSALERDGVEVVPFCPEEEAGLGTPRPPAWIEAGDAQAVLEGSQRVVTDAGNDVTGAFVEGARGALERCRERDIRHAYLKERSPSCGVNSTHVDGVLVEGPGVTAAMLARAGIEVHGVEASRRR